MRIISKPTQETNMKKVEKETHLFSKFKMYVLFGISSFLAIAPLGSTNADYTIQKKGRGVNFESACWSPPSVPVLKSPSNQFVADLASPWLSKPVFDWSNSETECADQTISYDYEIYLGPELQELIATGSVTSSQVSSSLSVDGEYYWRVRAKDNQGHISEFSEPWKVSINRATLTAPTILGWNLQSKSTDHKKTPVDLVCGDTTNGGDPNTVSLAPYWNLTESEGVVYQLQLVSPTGSTIDRFYTNDEDVGFLDMASFSESHGLWKTKARTFVDANTNSEHTEGELASNWSNECLVMVDKNAPEVPAIVMNEIFPSPSTNGTAHKPDGEWVELYNRSSEAIDVSGWTLYDTDNGHELKITSENSDNNDNPFDSGETVVPGHGHLVVYRNGDTDFDLDDNGDTVRLFSGTVSNGSLKDSYTFSATPQDKSIARIGDGANNWIDPVGTPGRNNVLHQSDLQPSLNINQQDLHRLQLGLFDAINYQTAHLTVQYMRMQDDQLVQEEFTKNIDLNKNDHFIRDLFLGTVSSDVEYPHFGIEQVKVQIVLTGSNIPDRTLSIDLGTPWSETQ